MNRRDLFKRTAAGLILAAGAGELLVPERRVWALGRWTDPHPTYALVNAWDAPSLLTPGVVNQGEIIVLAGWVPPGTVYKSDDPSVTTQWFAMADAWHADRTL